MASTSCPSSRSAASSVGSTKARRSAIILACRDPRTRTHARRPTCRAISARASWKRRLELDGSERDSPPRLAGLGLVVGANADERQHFFTDAVPLFEVRRPRENERVDAGAQVAIQPLGRLLVTADDADAGTAP